MSGRIKSGEGTLIGNAGEFFVAAELLKQGVIAALAPRNAHSLDIVASKGTKTARIRVKTKSAEYTDWQWAIKKDGKIFKNLSSKGDFVVMVNLTKNIKHMDFYIVPTHLVNKWLVRLHKIWEDTPGRNGRPHSKTNTKRHLSDKRNNDLLKPYRGKWNLLWK
jgi:Holliday junction resolvase-like predicted endonuclease